MVNSNTTMPHTMIRWILFTVFGMTAFFIPNSLALAGGNTLCHPEKAKTRTLVANSIVEVYATTTDSSGNPLERSESEQYACFRPTGKTISLGSGSLLGPSLSHSGKFLLRGKYLVERRVSPGGDSCRYNYDPAIPCTDNGFASVSLFNMARKIPLTASVRAQYKIPYPNFLLTPNGQLVVAWKHGREIPKLILIEPSARDLSVVSNGSGLSVWKGLKAVKDDSSVKLLDTGDIDISSLAVKDDNIAWLKAGARKTARYCHPPDTQRRDHSSPTCGAN